LIRVKKHVLRGKMDTQQTGKLIHRWLLAPGKIGEKKRKKKEKRETGQSVRGRESDEKDVRKKEKSIP